MSAKSHVDTVEAILRALPFVESALREGASWEEIEVRRATNPLNLSDRQLRRWYSEENRKRLARHRKLCSDLHKRITGQ